MRLIRLKRKRAREGDEGAGGAVLSGAEGPPAEQSNVRVHALVRLPFAFEDSGRDRLRSSSKRLWIRQ